MSKAEVRRFEALVIPNDALERGGIEVLRAAIVEGDLHVTLRRTFEQPHHWGELLSEVAERIARSYAADGKLNERDVIVRIRSSFISDEGAAPAKQKPKAKAKKKSIKKSGKKPARRRNKR